MAVVVSSAFRKTLLKETPPKSISEFSWSGLLFQTWFDVILILRGVK